MTPLEEKLRAQLQDAKDEIVALRREVGLHIERRARIQFQSAFKLTVSEASVLSVLYSAKGRIVPHSTIFDALYCSRSDGGPAYGHEILKVYVLKMRHKIGGDAISTSWGVGYSLSPQGIELCEKALAA